MIQNNVSASHGQSGMGNYREDSQMIIKDEIQPDEVNINLSQSQTPSSSKYISPENKDRHKARYPDVRNESQT